MTKKNRKKIGKLTSLRPRIVSLSGCPSVINLSASSLTSVTLYSCEAMSFWNSSNLRCNTSTCSKSCPNSSVVKNVPLSVIQNITSSHWRKNCTRTRACCSFVPFSASFDRSCSHNLCSSSGKIMTKRVCEQCKTKKN